MPKKFEPAEGHEFYLETPFETSSCKLNGKHTKRIFLLLGKPRIGGTSMAGIVL